MLQLQSHPSIFALGGITDLQEAKTVPENGRTRVGGRFERAQLFGRRRTHTTMQLEAREGDLMAE